MQTKGSWGAFRSPRPRDVGGRALASWRLGWVLLAGGMGFGCRDEEPKGEAPPAESLPTSADLCAERHAPLADPVLRGLLPQTLNEYCIDPNDQARVYGENATHPLDAVCVELFNGECELYKSYGLGRVASVRYRQSSGSGVIDVTVSTYASDGGAYAFFTHRVLGESGPRELTTEHLELTGQGAVGAGVAYVRRGPNVVELAFSDERLPPDRLRAAANAVVPVLAKRISEQMRGEAQLPLPARLLPAEQRVPLGVRAFVRDSLGIQGAGSGALGFYEHGGKHYSIWVAEAADEGAAKDVEATLRRAPGAHKLKDMPFNAFELRLPLGGRPGTWLVGRSGRRIAAAGDDPFSYPVDAKDEQRAAVSIDRTQRLTILRSVLSGGG